jgi:hypothetical protein
MSTYTRVDRVTEKNGIIISYQISAQRVSFFTLFDIFENIH